MNHDETIKRIQELVPSIMDLEFGCEILTKEKYSTSEKLVSMIVTCVCVGQREVDTTHYKDLSYDDVITILGKPITLAVVLRAIEVKYRGDLFATVASNGWFHLGSKRGFWNLSKDNFNDQADETKTFIGGLLK